MAPYCGGGVPPLHVGSYLCGYRLSQWQVSKYSLSHDGVFVVPLGATEPSTHSFLKKVIVLRHKLFLLTKLIFA